MCLRGVFCECLVSDGLAWFGCSMRLYVRLRHIRVSVVPTRTASFVERRDSCRNTGRLYLHSCACKGGCALPLVG
jgi:hypothetical protein